MAKLTKLKDIDGVTLYPMTLLSGVYKDNTQTAEQWLESALDNIDDKADAAIININNVVDTKVAEATSGINALKNEYNEKLAAADATMAAKIETYDNLASVAVQDVDVDSIVAGVEAIAEEKKAEIRSHASSVDTAEAQALSDIAASVANVGSAETAGLSSISTSVSNVGAAETTAINTSIAGSVSNVAAAESSALNDIQTTKEAEQANILAYSTTKQQELETLAVSEKQDLKDYEDAKEAEMDALYDSYSDNLAAAVDSNHVTQKITRTEGVHGLRWNNDAQTLQYQDSENAWQDAAAKINLTQTIDANSTEEEVPSAAAVYNAGGIIVSDTQPTNTKALWIDTGHGGAARYYDGAQWAYVPAVWG